MMESGQSEKPVAASVKSQSLDVFDPMGQRIWEYVSQSPLRNLWDFEGASVKLVFQRTLKSFLDDNLLSRAAELGYFFLFALFPTLVSASAILGLAARSASQIYVQLLNYLALVIPASAFAIVVETFNQTTAAATSGKVTLGIVAALWSASMGFSAIQDGMNTVYRVRETRPYWKARGSAILVTMLLCSTRMHARRCGLLYGITEHSQSAARLASMKKKWSCQYWFNHSSKVRVQFFLAHFM